jgi:epoxyqueuosine reductase QueG
MGERTEIVSGEGTQLTREGEELEAFARSLGADIYGVARAEAFEEFPKKPQPSKFVPDAKSVLIVGMPFTPEIFATVAKPWLAGVSRTGAEDAARTERDMGRPPAGVERYFMGDENTILSHEVGLMGYKIAWKLHREGYQAFYFPFPFKQDPRFRTAPFYFTPAMYLAGMGQMGLNCSILTPEYGPRIWITAIITNKELPAGEPTGPAYYEDCKSCKECVKRCPSKSLDGKGWKNAFSCAAYGCCGTCLSVCPAGEIK